MMLERAGQFLFIVIVPLVVIGGGVVSLFAVGALFDVLDHLDELKGRIEGMFRRPPAPPRDPRKDHYYRPYWQDGV